MPSPQNRYMNAVSEHGIKTNLILYDIVFNSAGDIRLSRLHIGREIRGCGPTVRGRRHLERRARATRETRARARGQRVRGAAAAHAVRLVPVPQRRHVPRRGRPAGGRGRLLGGLRLHVPRALLGPALRAGRRPVRVGAVPARGLVLGGRARLPLRVRGRAVGRALRARALVRGRGVRARRRVRGGRVGSVVSLSRLLRAALSVRRGRVRGRALSERRHLRQRARLLPLPLPSRQDRYRSVTCSSIG